MNLGKILQNTRVKNKEKRNSSHNSLIACLVGNIHTSNANTRESKTPMETCFTIKCVKRRR